MEQRALGRSGLTVSAIGLGGNTFGATVDGDEAVQTIHAALDQGITFIDTADVYSQGRSEEIVGRAIADRREKVVVATKCGITLDAGPHAGGLSRRWIMQAAEDSLRRMNSEYIDLFYAHRPDASTPIDETLRAMDDLVTSGKVRYIGVSNFKAWEVARGIGISNECGFNRWTAVQNRWNLLDGLDSPELEDAASELGVGIIPYTPLASGILTGKYRKGTEPESGTRAADLPRVRERITDAKLDAVERIKAWAESRDHTPAEAGIAWLLAHPAVSSVIAGARTPEQVSANIAAASWQMTPEERDELTGIAQG